MSVRALRRGSIAASRVTAPATVNVFSQNGTAGNYTSTPDSAGNSITSDIDIRVKAAAADWTPAGTQVLMAKWNVERSWLFVIDPSALRVSISENGSTSTAASSSANTGFVDGTAHWVRVTWRNSDNRVQFFTSEDGTSWTQLGTDQTISLTGIFNSSEAVYIGGLPASSTFNGYIHKAELRNGIDGTVVQSFDATAVTKLGTRNPSSVAAGGPWTMTGSAWDWTQAAP